MKSKSVLSLAFLSCLTCASHAASLQFPGQPFPDPFTVPSPVPGFEADGTLNGAWTPSQGVNSDLLGFYATVGGYKGVGVGALVDDYSGVTSSFSISSSTATIGVAGATISDWFFQMTAPTLGDRNDFSIDIAGSTGSLISIDLAYDNMFSAWGTTVNGAFTGYIFDGGLYQLTASFGLSGGVSGAISSFDNSSSILFNDALLNTAGTFSSLSVTADKGGAPTWGDGYITVVPEPSSVMLVSLLPGFFILRRRR